MIDNSRRPPRRPFEDPLAELARLIGQEDPFADFVNGKPSPQPQGEVRSRKVTPQEREKLFEEVERLISGDEEFSMEEPPHYDEDENSFLEQQEPFRRKTTDLLRRALQNRLRSGVSSEYDAPWRDLQEVYEDWCGEKILEKHFQLSRLVGEP